MRIVILILVLLSASACEQSPQIENDSKVDHRHEPAIPSDLTNDVKYDSLLLKTIKGDFNGDRIEDILKERLITSIDNKSIRRLPKIEYDSLVELIYRKKPILSLQSENNTIPELILSKNASFGLLWIKNEGDLNNDGSDEISLVIDWADWSAVNTCIVYSLQNGEWTEFAKFGVREWQITNNPKFNGFIQENASGDFKVSTFNSEMNEKLIPLEEVLVRRR